jgi:hypothetical protein
VTNVLIYNFSGELEDILHLFPNERLARTAAVLRATGCAATVWDRANFDDLIRIGPAFMENLGELAFEDTNATYESAVRAEAALVLAGGFDGVLVNLWHGTGFKFSVDLARSLKAAKPSLPIYGIGQKVDWFSRHILDLTGNALDGLVTGLGYDAVRRLAAGDAPKDIPDLVVRDGTGILVSPRQVLNVDDFPSPEYGPDVYRNIGAKVPIYPLTLSNQACPNECAFCVRPENYGRRVRRRAIAPVLAEVRERLEHGVTHFRIEDSTPPRGALTDLAKAVIQEGLKGRVWLGGFCRVDSNSEEDFGLLREAGVLSLFFGIESLDDAVLHRLRKGIDYDTIRATLRKAHETGIYTVGSLMFPTPGETRDSMRVTLDRLAELRPHLDAVLVLPAGVYPPTDWGRHPERYGIRLAPDYLRQGVVYPVKLLVPMRHWKPFPFAYDLMGEPAERVTFADIVRVQEEFLERVRRGLGYPPVPDHYVLMAHQVGKDPGKLAGDLIGRVIRRDYEGICRELSVA